MMLLSLLSTVAFILLVRFYLQSPSSIDGVIEEMENRPWNFVQTEYYVRHKEGTYCIWTSGGLSFYGWYGKTKYKGIGFNGKLRFSRAYKKWSRWDVIRKNKEENEE